MFFVRLASLNFLELLEAHSSGKLCIVNKVTKEKINYRG